MEVEVLEVLELAARRREQLLADAARGRPSSRRRRGTAAPSPRCAAPAPASGPAARRCARSASMVPSRSSSVGRALAREPAQPAQRQLDVARAELDACRRGCGTRAASHTFTARRLRELVLADAHAFGVVAVRAERRGAARCRSTCCRPGAAPSAPRSRSRSVSHQLLPAAERLDLALLLLGQQSLGQLLQPLLRQLARRSFANSALGALEALREHAVEAVECRSSFTRQARAR